jgi:indolepyruvate ferredoxin oxidoreductase beta subunit
MHSDKKIDQFNMVIAGTGGQGLITLLQVVAEAALFEGLDIRTSELHGLSQRGGSVEVHIKLGKKVYSPLIPKGRADLFLGLEMQETLREANFASQKTKFLVNKKIIPIPLVKNLTEKECLDNLKKISKNIILIPASEICKEKLGTDVVSGIYLISLAVFKGLIPIKPSSVEKAIKKIIPAKYLELNLKTFDLAKS